MQRASTTARAAGSGAVLLPLLVFVSVSVLPGASGGGDAVSSHGGRKTVGFGGEARGVARYLNKGANVEAASPPRSTPAPAPPVAGSPAQFRGQARLPRFAAPRRYDLRIRPDLVACTFAGSVVVTVAVSAPTRFLVLNAADLSVDRASIRFRDLAPKEVEFFEDDEILVLGFSNELPLGEGVFSMKFNGTLNDQMRGFYRSKYQYKGKMMNMAVTQFESVDARRCFPCWDEPSFKIAITVAHELAHQWFGNLVTMEWWTHLWLNEGFATWMSNLAVDSFFPQWNIWTQFLDDTTAGLKLDSLEESHPIEVEIHHASEVDEIFDAISYDKGASVIRMLQNYLGAERFQKALASYIRKFAYSNAKTEDLWAVLEEKSGEPVKNLMTTWTKQQGYPVINAKLKGNYLELEQAQFLLDGSSGPGMWIVPITAGCGSYATQKKFLLKGRSDRMDVRDIASQCGIEEKGGNFWIKLNINQTGFYRVQYDDKLAAALQNALQAKKLSVMDKIGIVEDSHALSMACKQTLTSLLRLLYAYREEADYSVLSHINTVSLSVAKISVDATPGLVGDIKQLLIKLLLPPAVLSVLLSVCYDLSSVFPTLPHDSVLALFFRKLGWDPKKSESHLDALLRPVLLVALVKLGHDKTIDEGVRRFGIFVHDRNTSLLPPDTRKAAYLAAMQNVTSSYRSAYNDLLKVYRESDEAEEKGRVLSTLCYCKDKNIVLESLNLLFTNEVRSQDAYYVLQGLGIETRETAWLWLKSNWDHITKKYSDTQEGGFIRYVVTLFSSNEKAAEFSRFFASRKKPEFERTLKQSLENVQINARWIQGIRSESRLAQTVQELLHRP
ncbi:Aminopeptidase M1-C [Dichanthelium oligosanthes]|uniref:Aminopeptidase n=1 Tax=Dichanthelium oligosanthes TaxID=888268 RepID=A0A1E5URW4_9POAL|nr:Aminopeptidase M1-C [Dichanthelium oligosanthes]